MPCLLDSQPAQRPHAPTLAPRTPANPPPARTSTRRCPPRCASSRLAERMPLHQASHQPTLASTRPPPLLAPLRSPMPPLAATGRQVYAEVRRLHNLGLAVSNAKSELRLTDKELAGLAKVEKDR